MIYHNNLDVLGQLASEQTVEVGSLSNLKVSLVSNSTPNQVLLLDAIHKTFHHYFQLMDMMDGPKFDDSKREEELKKFPNLHQALSGLQELANTYQTLENNDLSQKITQLYNSLSERLATYELESNPPQNNTKEVKDLTIEECHQQLNHIESSLISIINSEDSDEEEVEQAKKIMTYLEQLRQDLMTCYQKISYKCYEYYLRIVQFFRELTKTKKQHPIINVDEEPKEEMTMNEEDDECVHIEIEKNEPNENIKNDNDGFIIVNKS